MTLFKKYNIFDIFTYGYYIVVYEKIFRMFNTFIFYTKAKLLNIKVGNECQIFGKVNIVKFPSSKIKIGDKCNLISCNKKAGASTLQITRIKTFTKTATVIIENNVDLNGTSIACRSTKIHIKSNTLIGSNVSICDSDFHCIEPEYRIPGKRKACFENDKDVIIGENVWIGMNTIILKGVTIGDNTVVGAGSVVSKSLEANSVYVGNPLKKIKSI